MKWVNYGYGVYCLFDVEPREDPEVTRFELDASLMNFDETQQVEIRISQHSLGELIDNDILYEEKLAYDGPTDGIGDGEIAEEVTLTLIPLAVGVAKRWMSKLSAGVETLDKDIVLEVSDA